jgi:hypothetical protein
MSNSNKVDDNSDINDIRSSAQFKGVTFSGFKKTEVRAQLIENLKKGKVEPACYWAAELVCAGQYIDLWEILLFFMGKHIHLGNPKMAIYLQMRYQIFRNIISQGFYTTELQLRNHPSIRKLFAELICNSAMSNKKPSFETIKINRVEEFDITQLHEKLTATSTDFVKSIFKKDDPKELLIAMNEFAYNISAGVKNMNNACYWVEWMIEFDGLCKSKREPPKCEARNYSVENKFRRDIIWLVWDTLHHYADERGDLFLQKLMGALTDLFCIKYTSASAKKRKYLLYFAVALLTEPVPTNIEMFANKAVLETVLEKINSIYKQIKKNEHSPNTEYLFSGIESENRFETMVQKIEMMNSMDIAR